MKKILTTLLLSAVLFQLSFAQVRLPRLIRDSMVLQRDAKLKLWGWASAGEKVTVSFRAKNYRTTTGADGRWMLLLPPQKAGGPYSLQVKGKNEITLNNVLVGDVWVCAGQSNMVHQMSLHSERYAEDIATADNPQIRHFWIATMTDLQKPHDDLPTGYWKSANPQDILQFSAVAYFFARKIYEKYGVPIGLINASVGGTPIEAWTSEEGLKEFPSLLSTIQKNKDTAYVNGANRAARAWGNSLPRPQDKGLQGTPWYSTAYSPKNWRTITVPGYWEDQGARNLDGIVWYRKEITVPASVTGKAARMALGRIVDADVVYINGQQVSMTTYQYPQRRYAIPAALLKAGKNVVVVKVTNNSGKGGFVPEKPYYIAAGNDTLDLKGDWQYKVGAAFEPPKGFVAGVSEANQPTSLYNAMLAPATNHTIKGILWYQGESNIRNAAEYEKLLPALIRDWRRQWQQGDVPFLFVQLPNFEDVQYLPAESSWAVLREGTRKTLSVPNTGMAVTIDVGEWNDIHPDRKKEVGERLALAAMKVAYGEKNVVYSGPTLQSQTVDGNKVILTFTNTGSGLTTADGEALSSFSIAGADKKFVWAKASIEGDKVIVWSDAVTAPRYVRYAWADNPDNPNLYNKEGLPASPFELVVDK